MIFVELAERSLSDEISVLEVRASDWRTNNLFVLGALQTLRWLKDGGPKPSESLFAGGDSGDST